MGARGRIEQVGRQREAVASDAQTRSTVRRITTLEFIINASSVDLKKRDKKRCSFVRSFVRLCALYIIGKKKFGIVGRIVIIGRSLSFFAFYCFESRVYERRRKRERERERFEGREKDEGCK